MTEATRNRMARFLPYWVGRNQGGFGEETWDREVKAKMRTGIMEIFCHPPTRPLKRYAWYCAMSVDRRITARNAVLP